MIKREFGERFSRYVNMYIYSRRKNVDGILFQNDEISTSKM
jgi:hypothetical protein